MGHITPVVLAIGTTHPLNIAGVGLDARVAGHVGVRLVTIVAGVSAQTATAVLARTALDEGTIRAQFAAVRGLPIAAVHIGALLDRRSVQVVAHELEALAGVPTVFDPVIAATGGDRLADDATLAVMRDELLPRCSLVTPNLDEAGLLLGASIETVAAMEAAGTALRAIGAAAVLVKGGHLSAEPVDVLVTAEATTHFSAERIAGSLRGTGDLLACAIAARLAHGDSIEASVRAARDVVRTGLLTSVDFAGTRTLPY